MITPGSFKYVSRVIHNDLGLSFNFNSIRHTHATMLLETGTNITDTVNTLENMIIQK
jgi:hypothetical protein